ncbi:MAG: patatin family protein [Lachnospiraceae bacterium]|nr:patatin family protein [Lachnospiraceae bacterium]
MIEAGLVLEGGGMKGIYTAGVLDYFMDKGLQFSAGYGVSMGACNLCSYISGQRGRGAAVTLDYIDDPNYCGIRPMLKTGDLFNVKMAYTDIPMFLNPFDFEAAAQYPGKAYAVLTDVETGKPVYAPINDLTKSMDAVRASASMPLVSRLVEIGGRYYLDGGISDSIPIMKSLRDGNRKNVVVMTKEVGYIRKPFTLLPAAKVIYRKYPALVKDLRYRHARYNKVVRFLEREHEKGNLFLIRPQHGSEVGRVERDRKKLEMLYEQGFTEARACYDDMMRYLEQ